MSVLVHVYVCLSYVLMCCSIMLACVAGLDLLCVWIVCQSILVDTVLAELAKLYMCWPLWPSCWLWPTLIGLVFDLYWVFVCQLCFNILCIKWHKWYIYWVIYLGPKNHDPRKGDKKIFNKQIFLQHRLRVCLTCTVTCAAWRLDLLGTWSLYLPTVRWWICRRNRWRCFCTSIE